MRHVSCALAFLVLLGPATVSSQAVEAPSVIVDPVTLLTGSYKYVGDSQKDLAKIDKSIEAAITSLGWLGRKIARNRLATHKELPQRIEISRNGKNISIVMGTYSAVAPEDGTEREVVAPNGRDSKLHYELEPGTIVQYFIPEQAKRKSTYSLNQAGQLVMTVFMTSDRLASPVEFALVYERE